MQPNTNTPVVPATRGPNAELLARGFAEIFGAPSDKPANNDITKVLIPNHNTLSKMHILRNGGAA
jgi:hypothetical protein